MNIQPFFTETTEGDFMLTLSLRTVIIYFFLIFILRIMGKRQIGQLQPVELVITIMISEIAVSPLDDTDSSMLNAVIPVLVLALLEISVSFIALKSIKIRRLIQGSSVVVIKNGKPDIKQMKKLRYSTDDLLEALRQKDVFDINDVEYAIAETDGSLSVLLRPGKRAVTAENINAEPESTSLPRVLITDGRLIDTQLEKSILTEQEVEKILKRKHLQRKDVLLFTADENGNINIIEKKPPKRKLR